MQDLTNGMQQPCIMDLKIGKQTWDPCASEEKRKKEDGKYVDCKNNLGFCIPGFQTHHILSNSFKKYGRDYGKKLNERTAIDGMNEDDI
jgi:inositol-polyphosphate multikinase